MSNTYKDATLLKALAAIAILSTNLSAANFMDNLFDDSNNKLPNITISTRQDTPKLFDITPLANYQFYTQEEIRITGFTKDIGSISLLPQSNTLSPIITTYYTYTPDANFPKSDTQNIIIKYRDPTKNEWGNLTLTIFAKPEFSKDLVIPTIVGKPHRLPFEKPVNLPADVKQSVVVTAPDSKFGTFSHTEDAFTFTPSEELINANAILKYHINCGDNYGDTDPITITFKYHESSLSLTRAAYSFVIAPIFNAIGLTLEKTKDYTMQSGVWKKFSGLFGR